MNLLSPLGPSAVGNLDDDRIGGPLQRTLNGYWALLSAINVANMNSNITRRDRLTEVKVHWENKAEMLIFYGHNTDPTAVEYSQELYQEVTTALAVGD